MKESKLPEIQTRSTETPCSTIMTANCDPIGFDVSSAKESLKSSWICHFGHNLRHIISPSFPHVGLGNASKLSWPCKYTLFDLTLIFHSAPTFLVRLLAKNSRMALTSLILEEKCQFIICFFPDKGHRIASVFNELYTRHFIHHTKYFSCSPGSFLSVFLRKRPEN